MKRLGTFAEAKAKVLADVRRLLATVTKIASISFDSAESGVRVLKQLRQEAYEELNQVQHEFMVIAAAQWILHRGEATPQTIWYWNPRNTGKGDEPDLRGQLKRTVKVSAEITTSLAPVGTIDGRMRDTLKKLSTMAGRRFYFTASSRMCRRANSKIRKGGWDIEAVYLEDLADLSVEKFETP